MTHIGRPISRRALLAGSGAFAGLHFPFAALAQEPSASPSTSPDATPDATPLSTPEPAFPLQIVQDVDLPDDATPQSGGTIRVPVRRANLTKFPPPLQQQDPLVAWSYLDPLVRIDPITMEPRPGLATDWAWSDDGLELTFHLRTDVLWHDGSAFTSADAAFSHFLYRDDFQSVVAGQSGLVEDISLDGNATMVVRFLQPDGSWLFNVASLPIFQRQQYLPWWDRFAAGDRTIGDAVFAGDVPVGTGPWKIEKFALTGISLTANQDYFDGAPFADALELVTVDDTSERLRMWRNGDLDLVPDLPPAAVDSVLNEPARLVVVDSPRTVFGAFNFDNLGRWQPDMLADPAIRTAINIALDRDRMASDAYAGFLRSSETGVVAQPWSHDTTQHNPTQDLTGARAMLQDAGWQATTNDGILQSPNGDSFVLSALVLDTIAPEVKHLLQLVDQDLRQIGGTLTIEVLPRQTFIERWQVDRTWDLLVYDLRLYPAFAEFDLFGSAWDIRNNPAGWNPGGYSNPDADDAIGQWFEATGEPEMTAALARLQRAVNDDLFGLWFGFPQDLVLLGDDVRGFRPNRTLAAGDTRFIWKATVSDAGATPVATPQPPEATPVS